MRRIIMAAVAALAVCLIANDFAEARAGGRGFGGGGVRAGGFGGGFRAGGFGGYRGANFGGGYRAVGIGGGRWAGGVGRPGWGGAGWAGRPVWGGARPGWGRWAGHRPGYRYRYPLYGAGLGLATAAFYGGYGGYYPYDYGYGDCVPIRQRIWDGYGYRVVWVNPCDYY